MESAAGVKAELRRPSSPSASSVQSELKRLANPSKAKLLSSFFKTGVGQYSEGDIFLGIMVPQQREVAQAYPDLPLPQISRLLASPIHEHRLTALLILTEQYRKADAKQKSAIVRFYLRHLSHVNNWDLVDLSAPRILGDYLLPKPRNILYRLVRSKSMWERRVAILSTAAFINAGQFHDTFRISQLLLRDPEDLIHKAVGWMLREVGKKDEPRLEAFLLRHRHQMPRTALRYAIERFEEKKRRKLLLG